MLMILNQIVLFSKEFINEFSEILDIDFSDLNDSFILRSGRWDSVTILRLVLLIQLHFKVLIHGELIYNCQQMKDLKILLVNKLNEINLK